MLIKIADKYPKLKPQKCSECDCNVRLCKSFVPYCIEEIKDNMPDWRNAPSEICDCFIIDSTENKIALVELKSGEQHIDSSFIKKVRDQLLAGLYVLYEISRRLAKTHVCLQLVLFTNMKNPSNRSVRIRLQQNLEKPLDSITNKIKIIKRRCGDELPNNYKLINVKVYSDTQK